MPTITFTTEVPVLVGSESKKDFVFINWSGYIDVEEGASVRDIFRGLPDFEWIVEEFVDTDNLTDDWEEHFVNNFDYEIDYETDDETDDDSSNPED